MLFVQERIVHMIWWWYSESNTFLKRWLRGLCVEMKLSSVQMKPLSITGFAFVCMYMRVCVRRKHMLQSIRNSFPIMMIKRGWLKCFARFHSIYLWILYKNSHQLNFSQFSSHLCYKLYNIEFVNQHISFSFLTL